MLGIRSQFPVCTAVLMLLLTLFTLSGCNQGVITTTTPQPNSSPSKAEASPAQTTSVSSPAAISETTPSPAVPSGTGTPNKASPALELVWSTSKGSPLKQPLAAALDKQGNLIVLDGLGRGVLTFDAQGKYVSKWLFGASEGYDGLAVGTKGNIYIGDFDGVRILNFDHVGKLLGKIATEQPVGPVAVALDSEGNIYVLNHHTHQHYLQKFEASGKLLLSWAADGTGDGQMTGHGYGGPLGLALGKDGSLYAGDYSADRIVKFDTNGKFLLSFGKSGTGEGEFQQITNVVIDGLGNVYVSDGQAIQKFDSNGHFLARWTGKGGSDGEFHMRYDMGQIAAADAEGNLYVIPGLDTGIVVQKYRQR